MPATFVTDLPDEDEPVLLNGVEDEITADRESATTNYGDVRIQIRETEQSSWDSAATGFAEQVVAYDTLSVTFGGLEDGEAYEVRARTETEHLTGAWTDPVSIITAFPTPAGFSVDAVGTTSVACSWTDQADSEDGFTLERRRLYDDGWGRWRDIVEVGPNTESATDDSAQPGRTYEYRVEAYTEDTSVRSDAVETTTDSIDAVQEPTGSQGWQVSAEHPSGSTLRPTVLDGVEWMPRLNGLPRVRFPVPKADVWEGSSMDGAPITVWKDGHELPIDEIVTTERGPDQDIIEAKGGVELDQHVEGIEIAEKETHLAANDVIEAETSYICNADDPQTDTRSDVLMGRYELTDEMRDAVSGYPFPDDDPREIAENGILRMHQTGWFAEAEDNYNGATRFADVEGNDGAWSGNTAVLLTDNNDNVSMFFENDYVIPQDECEFAFVFANPDAHPAFDVQIRPSGGSWTTILSVSEGSLSPSTDMFDLQSIDFSLNPDSALQPGTYEARLEVTSTVEDGFYVDFLHVRDDRFQIDQETNVSNSVVQGWQQRPLSQDFVFESISSVEQVVGGSASVDINDTSNAQALALRNDPNDAWTTESNTSSISVDPFSEAGQEIQLRVTLSRYDASNNSGFFGSETQEVSLAEIYSNLENTPVLLDKSEHGNLVEILNDWAGEQAVWEVRRQPDGTTTVEWTQPGQRSLTREPDLIDYSGSRTIEGSYQRAIVFGAGQTVRDARVTLSNYDSLKTINEDPWIIPGSERVYDVGNESSTYERGTDYGMDYQRGAIEIFSSGNMTTGTEYAVDYEFKVAGEYTVPGATDPDTREEEIPGASSDRECDQLALSIVAEIAEPLEEVTVTIDGVDPTLSLVESLDPDRLPFEGSLEIRELSQSAQQVQLRLGSRRSVGEVIQELRTKINQTASRV